MYHFNVLAVIVGRRTGTTTTLPNKCGDATMFAEPGGLVRGLGDVASKITRVYKSTRALEGIRFVRQPPGFSDILAHVQHRAAMRLLTATG